MDIEEHYWPPLNEEPLPLEKSKNTKRTNPLLRLALHGFYITIAMLARGVIPNQYNHTSTSS